MAKLISSDRLEPDYGIKLCNRQRKELEGEGKFPKRVQYSARKHGYREEDILAFLGSKNPQGFGQVATEIHTLIERGARPSAAKILAILKRGLVDRFEGTGAATA